MARDAQAALREFRKRWPQYEGVDDATLLSSLQKKYSEYRDLSLSTISEPNNFLERAISASVQGPIGLTGGGRRAEDVAVPFSQLASEGFRRTPLGKLPGASSVIPALFTGIAESGRQGVRGLRGENVDLGDVLKSMGTAFATESIFKSPQFIFRRGVQRAAREKALRQLPKANVNLSTSIKNLKATGLVTNKSGILEPLENGFNSISFQSGPQAAALKRWIKILKSKDEGLDIQTLTEMENSLGSVAKFGSKGEGVSNPAMNALARKVRGIVSERLDQLGRQAEIPIRETSRVVSTLKTKRSQRLPEETMLESILPSRVATTLGRVTSSPLGQAIQKGLSVGSAEAIRQILRNT